MFFVYCIRNKVNDKLYIGWSSNYKKRWRDEISAAFHENSKVYNTALSRAFRKYAKEKDKVKDFFEFQVLQEFDDLEKSLKAENFWVELLKTNICKYGPNYGYNLTDGGRSNFGFHHSEESKKKISLANSGSNNPMFGKFGEETGFFGKTHSEDTRKQISLKLSGPNNRLFGKKLPEETKRKISLTNSGENAPMFGKKHSDESKKKMSLAKLGKSASLETRMRMSISKTGRFVSEETKKKSRGENNPSAKLNWEKVNEIRKRYNNGETTIELSKIYNMSFVSINRVVKYKTWKIDE